jgi:hypothetical protein
MNGKKQGWKYLISKKRHGGGGDYDTGIRSGSIAFGGVELD